MSDAEALKAHAAQLGTDFEAIAGQLSQIHLDLISKHGELASATTGSSSEIIAAANGILFHMIDDTVSMPRSMERLAELMRDYAQSI